MKKPHHAVTGSPFCGEVAFWTARVFSPWVRPKPAPLIFQAASLPQACRREEGAPEPELMTGGAPVAGCPSRCSLCKQATWTGGSCDTDGLRKEDVGLT